MSDVPPEVEAQSPAASPPVRGFTPLSPESPAMADQPAVVASPTGAPVIPPQAVPYVLLGTSVLVVVQDELSTPGAWDVARVLGLLVKLLPVLVGAASPGLRKK